MHRLTDNSGNVTVTDGFGMTVSTDANERVDVSLIEGVDATDQIETATGAALTSFWTSPATLVDLVWDELLTGAAHNVTNSAGKILRLMASLYVHDGTCQAGSTSNTVILDVGASAVDGIYDPSLITIRSGTGLHQTRMILEYDGSLRKGYLDRDWKVIPDATSDFTIFSAANLYSTNEGMAQGGTTNTITLNSLADAADDKYKNQVIFLRSGQAQDAQALIIAYNGTSKVATIQGQWPNGIPDSTTAYMIIGGYTPLDSEIQASALAAITAYDPPTNAEMTARTLSSASYATASAQTTAQNDLDTITGADGTTLATLQPNVTLATPQTVWEYTTRTLTASTNLNIPTAAENAAAWGTETPTAGGVITRDEMLTWLLSFGSGKIVKTGNVYQYYDDDDVTLLYTITIATGGRTN
jgi:hypothetical protein